MEYNDDIARDMLQNMQENTQPTVYFAEVAQSLAGTAGELDQLSSPLSAEVDGALASVLQIVEGQ